MNVLNEELGTELVVGSYYRPNLEIITSKTRIFVYHWAQQGVNPSKEVLDEHDFIQITSERVPGQFPGFYGKPFYRVTVYTPASLPENTDSYMTSIVGFILEEDFNLMTLIDEPEVNKVDINEAIRRAGAHYLI